VINITYFDCPPLFLDGLAQEFDSCQDGEGASTFPPTVESGEFIPWM